MPSDQYFTRAASGLRPFSDFDWFVVDSCGHLAVMASGGHGRVPRAVFSDRTAYWKLHDELVRAGGGDAPADVDPWEHYVAAGLSVFDYDLEREKRPGDAGYVLYRRANRPLTDEPLTEAPRRYVRQLRIAGCVLEMDRVDVAEHFEDFNY